MNLSLEVDFHVGKKQLKQILEKVINVHGATRTAEVLDDIKSIGYKYLYKSSHDSIYFRYDRAATETTDDRGSTEYRRQDHAVSTNVVLSQRKSDTKKLLKHGKKLMMN